MTNEPATRAHCPADEASVRPRSAPRIRSEPTA